MIQFRVSWISGGRRRTSGIPSHPSTNFLLKPSLWSPRFLNLRANLSTLPQSVSNGVQPSSRSRGCGTEFIVQIKYNSKHTLNDQSPFLSGSDWTTYIPAYLNLSFPTPPGWSPWPYRWSVHPTLAGLRGIYRTLSPHCINSPLWHPLSGQVLWNSHLASATVTLCM